MTTKRVTLKDIAEQLALSTPTVSRALADHPDISTETKARVRDLAKVLNYVPSYRARFPATKHPRLIALVVPEMNTFFVPSLISGINHVVQRNDYSLIVFQSDDSLEQERRLLEYCTHLSPEGVMLALSSETADLSHLEVLRARQIPVVLLDRTIETAQHSTITIDDYEVGREAGSYLIDRGHRRAVGVFGDPRQRISALRLKGFRRAYLDEGIALEERQLVRVTRLSELEAVLDRLLDSLPDATAIFVMSDELLVYTHRLLMRRGTKVPEAVSLLAISDGLAPAFLHPTVTHIRHSGFEVGERTAHILIGLIEHQSNAMMDVRIRTTMVELGSVATRRVG
jgi:DNA-binding LacI/PurR family transcriptional regulator